MFNVGWLPYAGVSGSSCHSLTLRTWFGGRVDVRSHSFSVSLTCVPVMVCQRFFVLVIGLFLCSAFAGAQEPSAEPNSHTNRLAKESSPYLLQHAHNPVDWYPWGEEAFAKAKREGKMIFLSVGYAACHWCHVMERESFVDPEIARIMNERFVCVKVDREERPDVDQIYMTAVQMISGNGGWPMSVFLLPDTRPFWGGTYFPARDGDRPGASGFLSIMNQIDNAWKTKPALVTQQAEALTEMIKANHAPKAELTNTGGLQVSLVNRVAESLADQYDPVYGGFGFSNENPRRPKFPEPSNLVFLIDRSRRESVDPDQRSVAKQMLIKSLDGMISGAMFDHLGGGFHRYSVDRRWQIPHFEKMLYDNGQLASVFSAAYQDTQRDEYRYVVEGICDFVIRELKAPGGAFYSALDADSEGEEGKFYRWTEKELKGMASVEGFDAAVDVYRLTGPPNFEGEYYAPDPGKPLTEVATGRGESFDALNSRLAPTRQAMFRVRSQRERPITDVKILTAWNGLMIAGLADAGRILEREDYTSAAVDAAEFLLRELRSGEGRLLRSYASDEAKLNAYVDDYAFLASGLISLHRATGDDRWRDLAKEVTDTQIELFWDELAGGFYFTSKDHSSLIVRVKDPVDSAIPSGASVSAENLQFLANHYMDGSYKQRLEKTLRAFVPLMSRSPAAAPRAAAVMAEYLSEE
jgi:uncharacterized protein YyaL (SSP411 family)